MTASMMPGNPAASAAKALFCPHYRPLGVLLKIGTEYFFSHKSLVSVPSSKVGVVKFYKGLVVLEPAW